jgi:thiosulfate/3-mercaptopyruvate sulfurtransferase
MFLSTIRCSLRPPTSLPSLIASRRTMSTQFTLTNYLVTPSELNSALQKNIHSKLSTAPRVIPLCASWFLPNDGRSGYTTFLEQRIPHARFFDLDTVKDPHSPYPHMLPSPKIFAEAMQHMGIRREDSVVVYDTKELGIFSAPRVGWMLGVFGHENVHVLNNFRKWVEEGYPTESAEVREITPVEYAVPELDEGRVVTFEEVRGIAREMKKEGAEEVQILDARSKGRWEGRDPEPREGEYTFCLRRDAYTDIVRSVIRTHPILHLDAHHRFARPERQDSPTSEQTPGSLQVQGC